MTELRLAGPVTFELRWKKRGPERDTFLISQSIVRQGTKKPLEARIIGIVTASNRQDPGAWNSLAVCDLAEFRADGWAMDRMVSEFHIFRAECRDRLGRDLETIFTIRLQRDGGAWPDGRAVEREAVWLELGRSPKKKTEGSTEAAGNFWVDLEWEAMPDLSPSFSSLLAQRSFRWLVSHHDFQGCPTEASLRLMIRSMAETGAEGIKIAATCRNRREVECLMEGARYAASASDASCVLSMGVVGRVTRIAGPLLGCPFTYGYLSGGAVAPGQLSVQQMREFYAGLAQDPPQVREVPELLDWIEARLPGAVVAE